MLRRPSNLVTSFLGIFWNSGPGSYPSSFVFFFGTTQDIYIRPVDIFFV